MNAKKSNTTTIYVQLLEEGTDTYRPTQAEQIKPGVYRILPTENCDPEDEVWEFLPGTLVRCEMETRTDVHGPRQVLVARQKLG